MGVIFAETSSRLFLLLMGNKKSLVLYDWAIDWCPSRIHEASVDGCKYTAIKVNDKKKTLNNVKTNIFIMKTFVRGNLRRALIKKHLLSITDGRGAK